MIYTAGGRSFASAAEAGAYMRSLTPEQRQSLQYQQRVINKINLNSHYGALPGSSISRMRRSRELDSKIATIWRRLIGGDARSKRLPPAPVLPGGASLQFPSSTVVRMYCPTTAEKVTKTGQENVRKMTAKMVKLNV